MLPLFGSGIVGVACAFARTDSWLSTVVTQALTESIHEMGLARNAMSPQYQRLDYLFSQCAHDHHVRTLENAKTFKKPDDPPEPESAMAPFILHNLHA